MAVIHSVIWGSLIHMDAPRAFQILFVRDAISKYPVANTIEPVSSKILDVSAVQIKQISSIYTNITAYVITSPLDFTSTLKTLPNDMVLDSTRLQKLVSCSSQKSRAIRETQTKASRSDYLVATRVAREAVLPSRSPLKILSLLL